MTMKKYIILFLSVLGGSVLLTSCLEKYLDKAPESGLNSDGVFTKFDNAKKFFDFVYNTNTDENGGVYYSSELRITAKGSLDYDCVTDFCDAGRVMWWAYHKWGPLGDNNVHFGPMLPAHWSNIRRVNLFLQNVNKLTDGKQEDIDDLIAQAHFIRGFCHFEIFRLWGPMPYLTKVVGPDDAWDIPRLPAGDMLRDVAADMDTAVTYFQKAGKMRRDPTGNLNAPDQKIPNGCTALAYKSRALLYAASPLNVGTARYGNGTADVADWQAAAVASWEAIKVAEQNGYALLTAADYTKNYFGTTYTNEMLWGDYYGLVKYNTGITKQPYNAVFCNSKTGNSGLCPTQGTVDMWETKWGDPLNTQADRDAATALGHYNEQDPFVNRDPRFYIDIIYNGAPIPGYGTAKIYTEVVGGVAVNSELIDRSYAGTTRTGYYVRKIWGGQSILSPDPVQLTCAMIRLGELYLNYAEAANEAYGPNTAAPGASMTAVQAINTIRGRWSAAELAPVQAQFTANTAALRPRIRNERNIELSWEGHYYYDIRRWKTAPVSMAGPLMGNVAEKVAVSPEYPTGFKYTRLPLSDDRQSRWYDAKYYLPFLSADYYKMKKFDPGQVW